MRLTANFESWYIGDGSYEPFHRGQLVNLAFQMQLRNFSIGDASSENCEHMGYAQYRFVGRVLRTYSDDDPIAVIEASNLKFFIEGKYAKDLREGLAVFGEGTLSVDYYIWAEYLNERANPPDIFYDLRVSRILTAQIPERLIARHPKGKSLPATVPPQEVTTFVELETMVGQPFDEEFYVIDFETVSEKVPPSFIGATGAG